ncbi:non-hydrolyzing UDP-N-acetylglucosamine 2-epimerase [Tenacibaculum sp. IB213877]|uniref:non-hydrolyzing UDP-N-acetylglucosamine 2-epimerase n=1 Tax=Tenacibaculum sp. IB213877 TaxID=3097351 RepID=UPI002A5A7EA6|nr:UDP-N-acetylglucosamine 2-epimerase (non-hydrolyzing) [Tenacibaculum sp. IB213877]MDY0781166.1 UDP-N-acetylglucosamine 2-epimerase (non-hydrolyzing) [Tenacibaculum sp. IB213877]
MKKIVTILGARPQFIKGAVLSRVIKKHNKIEEVIVHTGQHFDANMSQVFFDEMQIPQPKYNLAINGLNHGAMTGQMLEKIEKILMDEKPDAVVVYGDTNSTIAGALAAKKLHIKVVHIEAGLRSFNMKMPEEVNRILTDRISDLLVCPTDKAVSNLQDEGFNDFSIKIEKHGDIMKDAMDFYSKLSEEKSNIIQDLALTKNQFVLATIHRQENTDFENNLKEIFAALDEIHEKLTVVLPLHPRTKKMLDQFNIRTNIKLIDPVGYFDMINLLKNCKMVLTDSGGLQKEAFFNKKHCVIIREETEWIELVNEGFAKLTGANKSKIITVFKEFIHTTKNFNVDLYGTDVGEKIYTSIKQLIQ